MEKSLEELGKLNYQELAYEVLSKFLDFTEEELKACIRGRMMRNSIRRRLCLW